MIAKVTPPWLGLTPKVQLVVTLLMSALAPPTNLSTVAAVTVTDDTSREAPPVRVTNTAVLPSVLPATGT